MQPQAVHRDFNYRYKPPVKPTLGGLLQPDSRLSLCALMPSHNTAAGAIKPRVIQRFMSLIKTHVLESCQIFFSHLAALSSRLDSRSNLQKQFLTIWPMTSISTWVVRQQPLETSGACESVNVCNVKKIIDSRAEPTCLDDTGNYKKLFSNNTCSWVKRHCGFVFAPLTGERLSWSDLRKMSIQWYLFAN